MFKALMSVMVGRSWRWPKVRDAHLKAHPACAACGEGGGCVPHHIRPVWKEPERELDPTNLITLCPRCHLLIGHLGSFTDGWNEEVVADAAQLLEKVKNRKTGGRAPAGLVPRPPPG